MIERCPHCGVRVIFQADACCPHCGVDRAAPVTEAHVARAAEIRAEQARRPALLAAEHRRRWRQRSLGAVGVGVLSIGLGSALTAGSFASGNGTFWFGLIFVGLFEVVTGLVGLALGTPPDAE